MVDLPTPDTPPFTAKVLEAVARPSAAAADGTREVFFGQSVMSVIFCLKIDALRKKQHSNAIATSVFPVWIAP
jgi:hypothetical protein